MKNIEAGKACQLRRLILATMLVASGVLLAALTLIIIGTYDNYQARLAAETVLNRVALGALLTLVGSWYAHVFTKPYLTPACAQRTPT
jgi:hypothetical protein